MSANLPGFGERVRGHRWQGRGRQEDLAVQSAAAAASATQERTVLPRLCALPWKQSWILNRDARGRGREPTVCCPFGLTACCPSPGSVVAAPCPAGGRGAEAEGPRGAGGAGEGSEAGPREKD